jgi:hypothetical protein
MTKFIMFIMIVTIGFTAKAQVTTLQVNNTTGCGVWLIFHGSTGPCNTDYSSQAIYFGPGASAVYANPAAVPGGLLDAFFNPLGPGGVFTRVRLLKSDPNVPCSPGGASVTGSGCSGPSSATMTVEVGPPPLCLPCSTATTIQWLPVNPTTAQIFM